MCIVDWDQFWLTLAAWWFFVDWDDAFCARLPAAEAPVPAAPSYPYLASYAVFLLSFATVRLLSSCARRRETNHEQ